MMRILVTGANGFLGYMLCKELKEQGFEPLGYVRSLKSADQLVQLGIQCIVGSLNHQSEILKGLTQVDAVIHAAGGGRASRPTSFYENNVIPTENLLNATLQAQVKRLILVSSLAAVGPSLTGIPHTYGADTHPISPYGESKALAEQLLLQHASSIHITIFRPPTIYGPQDWRLLPLFKTAQKGWIPALGGKEKTLSMIHVQDCAQAIISALQVDLPSGQKFFIDDGSIHSLSDIATLLGAIFERPSVRLIPIPSFMVYGAAHLNLQFARLMRREPLLTPHKAKELLYSHWICESQVTQNLLGWKPKIPLKSGFTETAQWYRDHAWLSSS